MNLQLRTPTEQEFQQIRTHIAEYELDDRSLHRQEFIAAFSDNKLTGFGRLRIHPDCTELCSLGVITPLRGIGIGKTIVAELINRSDQNLFLTCIIPEFFIPFGFHITKNYPPSMQNKLEYCTNSLCVPETYVVMKLEKLLNLH